MEALLTTVGLLIVILLVMVVLSRVWVRSSRLGGYGVSRGPEGDQGPRPPEDDDVAWHWDDGDGDH